MVPGRLGPRWLDFGPLHMRCKCRTARAPQDSASAPQVMPRHLHHPSGEGDGAVGSRLHVEAHPKCGGDVPNMHPVPGSPCRGKLLLALPLNTGQLAKDQHTARPLLPRE